MKKKKWISLSNLIETNFLIRSCLYIRTRTILKYKYTEHSDFIEFVRILTYGKLSDGGE